jgi:hypothetical protein
VVISHTVHLLSPPERSTVQAGATSQSGLRDFGSLLQAQEADGKTPQGRERGRSDDASSRESSQDPIHTLTMAEPGSAALPAAAQMAEQVDTAVFGGVDELVSVPWRLQASAGLSYFMTAGAGKEETSSMAQQNPTSTRSDAEPLASAQFSSPQAANSEGVHSLQSPDAGSKRDPVTSGPAASSEATSSAKDASVTSPVWPERLMRWLADTDGNGTTAWIRDYRMDPAQATRLIDSLRGVADQQGRQLNRIVLNGHELWRADSTLPDTQPKG